MKTKKRHSIGSVCFAVEEGVGIEGDQRHVALLERHPMSVFPIASGRCLPRTTETECLETAPTGYPETTLRELFWRMPF